MKNGSQFLLLGLVAFVFGCGSSSEQKLAQLNAEIVEMIGTPSCTADEQCQILALSSEGCDPEYLVYSTETADFDLLNDKAKEYNEVRQKINEGKPPIACPAIALVFLPPSCSKNGLCEKSE